jgi:hypothetical protein
MQLEERSKTIFSSLKSASISNFTRPLPSALLKNCTLIKIEMNFSKFSRHEEQVQSSLEYYFILFGGRPGGGGGIRSGRCKIIFPSVKKIQRI